MNRSRKMTVGLVLLAVLAALDIVGVAGAGMDGAPPLGVIVVSALLGVVMVFDRDGQRAHLHSET